MVDMMRARGVFVLVLVCIGVWTLRASADVPAVEWEALGDIFRSLHGSQWLKHDNWMNGDPCTNNWFGVQCSSDHSRVVEISLVANNLVGTIPDQIGDLSQLMALDFNGNSISGSIPASIGRCQQLYAIGMTFNSLTGPLPEELGTLSQLHFLHLDFNSISGSIPASLGQLKNIEYLGLYSNALTGEIPASLFGLLNANYLVLSKNQLTGQIPAFTAPLPKLQVLALGRNSFTNGVPEMKGMVGLQELDLYDNELGGQIPESFGDMEELLFLGASNCALSGSIPASLASCRKIFALDLSENQLSGHIPDFVQNLNKSLVDLSQNPFACPIPSWAEFTGATCKNEMAAFENFYFSDRKVDGDLVLVRVYGMAKCPDMKSMEMMMIDNVLPKIGSIIDLEFNFVGVEDDSMPMGAYSMHGQTEAAGTRFQLCVGELYPDLYLKFISCLNENQTDIPLNVPTCASVVGIEYDDLVGCGLGEKGRQLYVDSIAKSAERDVVWSPTVYINDQFQCLWDSLPCEIPTESDIIRVICNAYKGSDLPAACNV